jgi:hypothetical protein
MSQPDPDRYKSRGRKERTPEQLKVHAMAREKARLVIAKRTKIKREMEAIPEETEPLPPQSTRARVRASRALARASSAIPDLGRDLYHHANG